MKIKEAQQFLNALADPAVKSKHFTGESLINIAFLKRKVAVAIDEYQKTLSELQVKVKILGNSYVPIDDTEESKLAYKDFVSAHDKILEKDIEGIKLNFIPQSEIVKVCEDTRVDTATILIVHLVQINEK